MLHIHTTAVICLLRLLFVSGIYFPPCLSSHDPSSSYHHPTSYLISPWKGFPSSNQLRLAAPHNSGHVTRSSSSVASSVFNQAHNPCLVGYLTPSTLICYPWLFQPPRHELPCRPSHLPLHGLLPQDGRPFLRPPVSPSQDVSHFQWYVLSVWVLFPRLG